MDTLPASIAIELDEKRVTLLLVQQYNAPIVATPVVSKSSVEIQNEQSLAVPGPRYQTIVVPLPPGSGATQVDLQPRYQDNILAQFSTSTMLVDQDSPEHHVANALYQFARLWHKGDGESLQAAIERLQDAQSYDCQEAHLNNLVHFNLGLCLYQQFRFADALQAYQGLSSTWWQNPACALVSHWAQGAIALERGDLDLAEEHLTASRKSHDKVSFPDLLMPDRLETQLYLGLVLMRLGRPRDGFTLLEESLNTANAIGSNILQGKININLGGFFEFYNPEPSQNLIEKHSAAFKHYERAFSLLKETGVVADTVTAQLNLGRLALQSGELDLALKHFQAALNRNQEQHNIVIRSYLYLNMGIVYELLGDVYRAKHYLQRSYDLREKSGSTRFQIRAGLSLGRLQRQSGQLQSAQTLHQACVDFYSEVDATSDVAEARYELAMDLIAAQLEQEAKTHLKTAAEVLAHQSNPVLSLRIQVATAKCLVATDEIANAQQLMANILPDARRVLALPELIDTLKTAAELHLPDTNAALALLDEACEKAESVRGMFESSRLGTNFNAKVHGLYTATASLLLKQSRSPFHVEQAIAALERGRASEFNARDMSQSLESTSTVKKKLSLLSEARISKLGQPDPEVDDAYFEALDELGAMFSPVNTTAESAIRLADYRDPSHAILYYLLLDEASYCVLLLDQELLCEPIVIEDLGELSEITSEQLSEHDLETLTNCLIPEPIRQRLTSCSRVTVVPHGKIHSVPFTALTLGESAIDIAYSLKTLNTSQPKPAVKDHAPLDLVIFADPDFAGASGQAGMRRWTQDLERLPWTAEEAKTITETFSSLECQSFVGMDANRDNLLQPEVKRARVLHIASHGFFDADLSEVVGLALSSAQGESGFISLTDLQNEGFSNDLVVISGCETGRGRLLSGEGTLSLARAFLAQGVRYVISTLWPVADRTTALFMKLFYEALDEFGDPVQSLKTAQLKLKQMDRYRAPKHWAAYQVHTTSWPSTNVLGVSHVVD